MCLRPSAYRLAVHLAFVGKHSVAPEYRGPVTIPHPYMPADAKIVISDSSDPALAKRLLDMWDKYATHGND